MKLTIQSNVIDSKSNKVFISPTDFPTLRNIDDIKHCNINGHFFPFQWDDTVEAGTIQVNSIIRAVINSAEHEKVDVEFVDYDPSQYPAIESIEFSIKAIRPYFAGHPLGLSPEVLSTLIKNELSMQPIRTGDQFLIHLEITEEAQNKHYFDSQNLQFIVTVGKVTQAEEIEDHLMMQDTIFGRILDDTECDITLEKHYNNHSFTLERESHNQFLTQIKIDWKKMGVGGLDNQVQTIIDELFLPRALSPEEIKKYGITFNKGALLYGPPGTGKTLIAKKISQMFTNQDKITLVNGPELKIKWVGESEENLRNIFAAAKEEWDEKGEKSEIHVFIFDEIDGLFPRRRNSDSGSKVEEGLVNQMLTLMDGVDSPQNILVFGLTNRMDIIDEALLRKGRLGVHIEISLPDEPGRRQILEIHTKAMRENGLLEIPGDYLDKISKRTENWSGSELAALTRTAANYSIKGNFDFLDDNSVKRKRNQALAKVTEEHFERAMLSISPQNGIHKEKIDPILREPFFLFSHSLKQKYRSLMEDIDVLDSTHHASLAIFGEQGTGKTALAVQLAQNSGAKCIELIQAKDVVMQSEESKKSMIEDAFQRANQSPYGVVILDGLKDILGSDPKGNYFSNELRIYLKNKMTQKPTDDKKLLIITTCDDEKFMDYAFGLNSTCNNHVSIEKIKNFSDVMTLLDEMGIDVEDNPNHDLQIKSMSIREFLYRLHKYLDGDDSIRLTDFLESQHLLTKNNEHNQSIVQSHNSRSEYIPYLGDNPGKRPTWHHSETPQRSMLFSNQHSSTISMRGNTQFGMKRNASEAKLFDPTTEGPTPLKKARRF